MQFTLRAPKEFWLGIVYLAFGGVGLLIGLGYPLGTASRMGPGYMPCVVASILICFGIVSLVRAVKIEGEEVGKFPVRPLIGVLGGVLFFAFFVERLGLVPSIVALALISAGASREFRFQLFALAGLAVFVAACCLLFVKGLGVPLPLLGSWFGS
jgi:Tripartite tricarboxylate transporter TctB family